jgi:uncharacterized protein
MYIRMGDGTWHASDGSSVIGRMTRKSLRLSTHYPIAASSMTKSGNPSLSALIRAARRGDSAAAQAAISSGANANELVDDLTPLMQAVIANQDDLVDLLLDSGAAVNSADSAGWTALHFVAQSGTAAIARKLILAGAVVEQEDKLGNTPLWRAVMSSSGREEVVVERLRSGADLRKANKAGISPEAIDRSIAALQFKM